MSLGQCINGKWLPGEGKLLESKNPANLDLIWKGRAASVSQTDSAIQAARDAFPSWMRLAYRERLRYLEKFVEILTTNRKKIQQVISDETGKPLWEADTEAGAMINKLDISKQAYIDRTPTTIKQNKGLNVGTRHKPHGVIAVFGSFNFPAHLPNGHIIPALLSGNTVVFKPSEQTPKVAELMLEYWLDAGIPDGVLNLVQGDKDIGIYLAEHPALDGIFFTGSFKTGSSITKTLLRYPHRIIALEMGGNNPLIVHEVNDVKAAVYNTIQSAFITAGQRCTCARRLILPRSEQSEIFVDALVAALPKIKIGSASESPEPFMGPVISNTAAATIEKAAQGLIAKGATGLVDIYRTEPHLSFLTPGLIDVTSIGVKERLDQEIFGPVLQLVWVNDFEEAILEANNTNYGLSAGIFSDNKNNYENFYQNARAGIVNWNKPLTGASSSAPFGGIGNSGNHRPSAYYAADYCAYPVASMEAEVLSVPDKIPPGVEV